MAQTDRQAREGALSPGGGWRRGPPRPQAPWPGLGSARRSVARARRTGPLEHAAPPGRRPPPSLAPPAQERTRAPTPGVGGAPAQAAPVGSGGLRPRHPARRGRAGRPVRPRRRAVCQGVRHRRGARRAQVRRRGAGAAPRLEPPNLHRDFMYPRAPRSSIREHDRVAQLDRVSDYGSGGSRFESWLGQQRLGWVLFFFLYFFSLFAVDRAIALSSLPFSSFSTLEPFIFALFVILGPCQAELVDFSTLSARTTGTAALPSLSCTC
eukprot:COSAG01_NODE_13702_length_1546_cov_8.788528_1_plen_266_part_00